MLAQQVMPKFVVSGNARVTDEDAGVERLIQMVNESPGYAAYNHIGVGTGYILFPEGVDGVRLSSFNGYNPDGKYFLNGVRVKDPNSVFLRPGDTIDTSVGLGNGR